MQNDLLKDCKSKLKFLLEKGLFHIFGSSMINNVILFITNILVVNLVSKDEYGLYSYAYNIVNFFLLARGIGLMSGMLQFASETQDSERLGQVYKYILYVGNIVNFFLALLIILYAFVGPITIDGTRGFLIAMCAQPMVQWMFDYVTTYFRTRRRNIAYARITNLNTILYFVFSVSGCYLFGVIGLVVSRYIAYLICIVVSAFVARGDIREILCSSIRLYREKWALMKYSIAACASNALSEVLYLLDVFLIGVYIADTSVIASYKVATQIPTALVMIPSTIVVFIYPYFAEHRLDRQWMVKNTKTVIGVLALINLAVGLVLFISAPLVIQILWGKKYADALPVLRILVLNYIISGTFRIPCGNILAMMRKVQANLIISIISGVSNIILDIVLIQYWNSIGAAIATVLVVIISSVVSGVWMVVSLRKLPQG